jgi:hypothetical protein
VDHEQPWLTLRKTPQAHLPAVPLPRQGRCQLHRLLPKCRPSLQRRQRRAHAQMYLLCSRLANPQQQHERTRLWQLPQSQSLHRWVRLLSVAAEVRGLTRPARAPVTNVVVPGVLIQIAAGARGQAAKVRVQVAVLSPPRSLMRTLTRMTAPKRTATEVKHALVIVYIYIYCCNSLAPNGLAWQCHWHVSTLSSRACMAAHALLQLPVVPHTQAADTVLHGG